MNLRLKKEEKIKLLGADSVYDIMQRVLLRESLIDRKREHFWTLCMDNANRLLNIELVSMGTATATLVEPMEVLSVPLQKHAVKLILVHNHPSGELQPSAADKDITDNLIQAARIVKLSVLDHLIISEKAYYSFAETGLMTELFQSLKYVPLYELKKRFEQVGKEIGNEEGRLEERKVIARQMKKAGYTNEAIIHLTGLSKTVVARLKGE
ncbi:MAG TPA: JAB domain-containing protein [Chitinophagaceae bacterium]|nr:JAB domain-containing protein [Chitinophagaceae bacterium]